MTVMDDDEWMAPPIDHLLDYVPVGARPLFAEQFREMLRWLEREQRNEARWFLLLRAWPVLVTGPILRRSDYARTPLGGSGRELDPAWTCNPDCDKKIRKDVQERVIAKRISKGDKNTDPPVPNAFLCFDCHSKHAAGTEIKISDGSRAITQIVKYAK